MTTESKNRLGFVALLTSLATLAGFQYVWLDEIALAQASLLRDDAHTRAMKVAKSIDDAMTSLTLEAMRWDASAIRTKNDAVLAQAIQRFRETHPWARLVDNVAFWDGANGKVITIAEGHPSSQTQANLEALQQMADASSLTLTPHPGSVRVLSDGSFLLMAPLVSQSSQSPTTLGRVHDRASHLVRHAVQPTYLALLSLRTDLLVHDLADDALRVGTQGGVFSAAIVDAQTRRIVAGNGPVPERPDAKEPTLRMDWTGLGGELLRHLTPQLELPKKGSAVRMVVEVRGPGTQASGPWDVVIWHKAGSVVAAVQSQRRRNIALSLTALTLLGGSSALILAAARRARTMAQRQVDFVAAVSHELRTPVAVIRSASENLADGIIVEGDKAKRYGELIRDESLRLERLVDSVLEYAGAQKLHGRALQSFDASALLRDVARELSGFAHQRGGTIQVDSSEELLVTADRETITRAVRNLIENAIKHGGENPRVVARVRNDGPAITFEIEDSGPGFSPDEVSRLFEPFFRGRSAVEARVPGNGLGLALVKRIANENAGSVSARNRDKGGAIVALLIPRNSG